MKRLLIVLSLTLLASPAVARHCIANVTSSEAKVEQCSITLIDEGKTQKVSKAIEVPANRCNAWNPLVLSICKVLANQPI